MRLLALCLCIGLAGCMGDPLFPAKPREIGVTTIGNVPPHLREKEAKPAPGAVRDDPNPEAKPAPDAAKPTVATTARNPTYGLIIVCTLLLVGGAIAVAVIVTKRRRRPKTPKDPTS